VQPTANDPPRATRPVEARRASPVRAAGAAWRSHCRPFGPDGSGTPDPYKGKTVVDRGTVGGARATVPNPSHPVGARRASPGRAERRGYAGSRLSRAGRVRHA